VLCVHVGSNGQQAGGAHAPFGAGRCSSQGARLAVATRIQGQRRRSGGEGGGDRSGSGGRPSLPERRASERDRLPHMHAWGSAPKGNVFYLASGSPTTERRPLACACVWCGARPGPARSMPFPPILPASRVGLATPKAPCKSACMMQAALYSLSSRAPCLCSSLSRGRRGL
jgi:hypothetical protein